MRYIYHHVAGAHVLRVIGTEVTVDGQTFQAPASFSPRVSLSGRVALVAQEPGERNGVEYNGGAVLVYVDGALRVAYTNPDPKGATRGRCPIAWAPDDTLYVLLGKTNNEGSWILTIAPDGSSREMTIPGYASEGLWKVTDRIYFGNENGHRVVNGRNLWNWDEDAAGNLAGKSDAGGPFGCVAYTSDRGQTWQMWPAPADLQETIYVSGTLVAATGFDTPEPDGVPWVPLTSSPPPVVVPPPATVDCAAAEQRAREAEQRTADLTDQVRRLGEQRAFDQHALDRMANELDRLTAIEAKYNRLPRWVRRYVR